MELQRTLETVNTLLLGIISAVYTSYPMAVSRAGLVYGCLGGLIERGMCEKTRVVQFASMMLDEFLDE
jgi:hypothetical protein